VAYNLSNRQKQGGTNTSNNDSDAVDLGKVATVFIVFGLLSLLTAWIYSMETEKVANASFRPVGISSSSEAIGPINVRKHNESYKVSIKAALYSQSWASIEGQVLDSQKEYLFAFGKELSSYSGRDYEGSWTELDNDYVMNVTFPDPGNYYILFNIEADTPPRELEVKVSKIRGSSLPHTWLGIILLIVGITLNEIKNQSIARYIRDHTWLGIILLIVGITLNVLTRMGIDT
jgi:hypothetical protein